MRVDGFFDRSRLADSDFSGRTLSRFTSVGSTFERCRFDGARLTSVGFGSGKETSLYRDCSFDRARLTMVPGGYARFENCSFRNVDIRQWFCFAVELVNCTFTGRIRKAFFNGTVPEDDRDVAGRTRNEFRGNDFSGCRLDDVAFRTGIDLRAQRLPDGPPYLYLYDAASVIPEVRRHVVVLEDLQLRKAALPILQTWELELEGGQQQLFANLDSFHSQEATNLLVQVIEQVREGRP